MIDKRLLANLEYNLGPLVMGQLREPDVVEILLNSDGLLWVERLGEKMTTIGTMASEQSRLVINLVASALDTVVTPQHPIVEGELPLDGSRFEGVIPPLCSAPTFSIRKKASRIFQLDEYVRQGIMPAEVPPMLIDALVTKKNILVVGGTGSGKTTLVNALIAALAQHCPDDRLNILEDTAELQSSSRNTQFFRTTNEIGMTAGLKVLMRMRPDRIFVGEARDGAALAILKAWNTGHPGGIATIHANSAIEGLSRLEELVAEATPAPKQRLIGQAIDMIVSIERAPGGRRLSELLRVHDFDPNKQQYLTENLYTAGDIRQAA